MAARPAKRQRKLVVDSSDEEDVTQSINDRSFGREGSPDSEPRKRTAVSSLSRRSKTTTSSFNNQKSPVKSRTASRKTPTPSPVKTGKKKSETASSQSLHSFFRPATEEQRWATKRTTDVSSQPDSIIDELGDADDLIQDDYGSYDEIFDQFKGQDSSRRDDSVVPSASKPAPGSFTRSDNSVKPSRPAKRFLLPTSPNLQPVTEERGGGEIAAKDIDRRPWSERFGPSNLDELAVHKKKVADVRDWLSEAIAGKSRRRMLVLHGPAGSGKTTTLSLLSRALGFDIVEWKSPLGSNHSGSGSTSLSAQFDEFLSQSNDFGNLALDDQSSHSRASQLSSDSATRRIILIEDFPSTLSRTSSALTAFRNSLRRYLASIPPPQQSSLFGKTNPSHDIPPVVIIVSETLLSTNASMADNFTMHRLLGPEICNHMGTSTIEFNKIAPTFMYKALDLTLKKEARHSMRKRIPSPAVLKKFSELGDIRSAISSLEFLCLRGDDSADWGGRVAAKSKNPSRENLSLTTMEKESLEMVSQRESSLGLFHAVGKVVYNKREHTDPQRREDIVSPPSHLHHFERPRISQVSVEDLMNETGTDVQTFSAALHENYPPSCDGMSFVEHLEDCIQYLSDSDLLGTDSRSVLSTSRTGVGVARSRSQGYGASIDTLRQDEISFHVAVRGMLFSLPDPVRRSVGQGASSGRRADAYKMYFPTSLRLWKDTEELAGLVDTWERRLLDTAATDLRIQGSEQKGVESWKSLMEQKSFSGGDGNIQTVVPTSVSRDDLLLYHLPYLSRIRANSQHAKELETITQFRGVVAPRDDIPDDDLDGDELSSTIHDWTTDPVKTEHNRHLPESTIRSRLDPKPPPAPPVEEVVEKLILSDDDIED